MNQTKRSYLFSFGDSSNRPIGMCAWVIATSPEEALTILRENVFGEQDVTPDDTDAIQYANVYINPDGITLEDIEDVKDLDDDDDDDDDDGGCGCGNNCDRSPRDPCPQDEQLPESISDDGSIAVQGGR